MSKLSQGDVRFIKERLAAGTNPGVLATRFDVHTSVIENIAKGYTWRNVT